MRISSPSRLQLLLQRRNVTHRLQRWPRPCTHALRHSSTAPSPIKRPYIHTREDKIHLEYLRALEQDVIFTFKEHDELAEQNAESVVVELEDKLNEFMEMQEQKTGRSARLADERKFYFQNVLCKAMETVKKDSKTAVERLKMTTTQAEITDIKMNNFRGCNGTAHFEIGSLPRGAVFMVSGENGAGKSTLMEAISWCFLNRPLAPYLSTEDVLNTSPKKDNFKRTLVGVTVDFRDGYRVTRTNLLSGDKIDKQLKVRGADGERMKVAEQQGVSETHFTKRYLGIGPDAFAQICMVSEGVELDGNVPQEQIVALDELFGMRAIHQCRGVLERHLDGTNATLMTCAGEKEHIGNQQQQINERVGQLEKTIEAAREQLSAQKEIVTALKNSVQRQEARIKALDDVASVYDKEMLSHREKLLRTDEEITAKSEILRQKPEASSDEDQRGQVELTLLISDLRQKHASLREQLDRVCMLASDTEKSVARRRPELSRLNAKLAYERGTLAPFKHRLSSLTRELEGQKQSLATLVDLIPTIDERITKLTRTNTLAKWWKSQLSDHPDNRGEFITFCRAAYVKHFTRSLAPIVRALNPGNLHLAKALFSVTPDMKLLPIHAKPFSIRYRSRGELIRTRLAMSLAVLQLARKKLRCHPGFVFVDDAFDGLDDQGAACLTLWLKEFARREGLRAFLVTEKGVRVPGHVLEVVRVAEGVSYQYREYVYGKEGEGVEEMVDGEGSGVGIDIPRIRRGAPAWGGINKII